MAEWDVRERLYKLEDKLEEHDDRIDKLNAENRVADTKLEQIQKTLDSIENEIKNIRYSPKELTRLGFKFVSISIATITLGITILSWLLDKMW